MPGKCDCGELTDWKEVGSTWICQTCDEQEKKSRIEDLRNALETIKSVEQDLHSMEVDTLKVSDLIDQIKDEIAKIKI